MVSSDIENHISGIRLSSVVPGEVTGEDKIYELTNMDLVMKLHFIKATYFFHSEAARGFQIHDLKAPMFPWLSLYPQVSGRIRCTKKGRPFIRCNDGGVRIVEAQCNKTMDEWLAMNDDHSLHGHLVYDDHVLGPDLGFSPLVFLQFTWFKCGGVAVGLSWTHILGDAFSAANFMNMWGRFVAAGHVQPESLDMPDSGKPELPPSLSEKPFAVKMVDPVGDRWATVNNRKMETHSFHVTPKQLNQFRSNICSLSSKATTKISSFEILTAMIWKSLAIIRGESEPNIVTIICRKNAHHGRQNEILSNGQVLGTVEADFSVAKADLLDLARLVAEKTMDESNIIEKIMEGDEGKKADFIAYGARLTFVNLEDADIYGLKLKKHTPVFVNYMLDGVGEEGAVLVLPGKSKDSIEGRTLTVTLPPMQLVELRNELKGEWGIV